MPPSRFLLSRQKDCQKAGVYSPLTASMSSLRDYLARVMKIKFFPPCMYESVIRLIQDIHAHYRVIVTSQFSY